MLISCPNCHNIYEIPDNLIPKTGRNFRCQSCAHIWHALPSDALGYEKTPNEEKPIVEAIEVPVPPYRPYPANKEKYQVPADGKSGKKTISSEELREAEGDSAYVPTISEPEPELHLMSDKGTSFTISMPKDSTDVDTPMPSLSAPVKEPSVTVSDKPHSHFLQKVCLVLLMLIAVMFFFRREVVAVYPEAENTYQKFGLSGQQNPMYLELQDISVVPFTKNGLNGNLIKLAVVNPSFYQTVVPELTVLPKNIRFKANKEVLSAHETATAEVFIPQGENTQAESLTIRFIKH